MDSTVGHIATNVADCRCVDCRGALCVVLAPRALETVEGRYRCTNCGKTYDDVWGVPFFHEYDEDDFIGLVEIAANAGIISPHSPSDLEHFYNLLDGYHAARDRAAFAAEAGSGYGPWLPVRYSEWASVTKLIEGATWEGRDVLDVGAGLGFDAYRFVRHGANVTALEHSPVLTREGHRTLPMIRWIGGAAHSMPFADASFDAVFCNAALHHVRDIPTSISEMLRVLKPGGVLVTTGDPFRADASADDVELTIFNDHPDVLLGVNEQVPRFRSFTSALVSLRDCIEPHLYTQNLHDGGATSQEGLQEWNFDSDRDQLCQLSGGLAMRVRLLKPTQRAAGREIKAGVLRAATLASWLDDQAGAMARLAGIAPDFAVDRPFPCGTADKFDLLNGWRALTSGFSREAYRRARWYLRLRHGETALQFSLHTAAEQTFEILMNGDVVQNICSSAHKWIPVRVEFGALRVGEVFTLEIRLTGTPSAFAEGLFKVRNREFVGGNRVETGRYAALLQTWTKRIRGGVSRVRGKSLRVLASTFSGNDNRG